MRRTPGAPAHDGALGLTGSGAGGWHDALPPVVRAGLDRLLRARGAGPIVAAESVAGGCVNHGVRVTDGRASWFAKWNADAPPGLFRAEAAGLAALRAATALRVPEVVGVSEDHETVAWLMLEDVPPGSPGPDWDERAGRGLALLHRDGRRGGEGPGWHEDNWIGTLRQDNGASPTWAAFWRDRRLRPQLRAARAAGHLTDAPVLDRLLERVSDLLPVEDEPPAALLHGDLWGGNAYADASGAPVLIDPAAYRGHGEVDVAMTELFGGFGPRFYEAYAEVLPLDEGYATSRRPLYQLYYLLVHVNLFGSGYVGRTLAAARAAEGAAP